MVGSFLSTMSPSTPPFIPPLSGAVEDVPSFLSLYIDTAVAPADAIYIVVATAGDSRESAMCII